MGDEMVTVLTLDTVCCKLQICVAVLKKLNSLNSNDNNSTNINYHQNEQ